MRPYFYQESPQFSEYYEERMKKHKESLIHKIDDLLFHINSTKDNIRAEEEVDRIRQRLKGKQNYYSSSMLEDKNSGGGFEQYSKFYDIPKKASISNPTHKSPKNSRGKLLDYQSESKYGYVGGSRMRQKTHYQ